MSKINYKLLIIIWLSIILILSSLSGNTLNKIPIVKIPYLDKIVHFSMYFILQFLFMNDYFFSKKYNNFKRYLFLSFLFTLSYGSLMEILQQYVFIKRSGDFFDFLANASGAITAIIFVLLFYNKIFNKKFKKSN